MGIIGENIRKFRDRAGLSQEQLAEMMGKSKNVVSNWENGQNSVKSSELLKLSLILKTDVNGLLGWETPEDVMKAAEESAAAMMADPLFAELEAIVSGMTEKERAQLLRMARAMKEDE